jgi:transposase
LDVHAETIAVAVAEADGEVRTLGTIPNRPDSVRRLMRKLGTPETLRVCYEAGPCGYVLYWQLAELGVRCEVIAPTLVPVRTGDRVKTDRRDAAKLARSYRSGDLTPVWVPDGAHEALRDLVRAREAAKKDQLRARHRLGKFLLRQGRRRPEGTSAWGTRHMAWIKTQHFEYAAQEATLVDYLTEVEHAGARIERLERAIDAAVGQVPERVAGEAAWSYTKRPSVYGALRKRQEGLSEEVKAIAWKAQHRLHGRYWRLVSRGKVKQQAVTAVARELLGFMWAIAIQCEREGSTTR